MIVNLCTNLARPQSSLLVQVMLWRYFFFQMRLTFISVDFQWSRFPSIMWVSEWVSEVAQLCLHNVGGPHLISWRPGKKKAWCPLGRSGKVLVAQSCPTLCDLMDCNPQLLSPWDSPGKNTGVGSHSLLYGIFLTRGLNLGVLHCRKILYHLSHQGSPRCTVRKREFCLLLPLDLRERHRYWFCLS